MAVPAAAIGAAKMIGGAAGQVGIQLALEKAFFNKDVQQTTKQTESAFSKSFGKVEKFAKSAFNNVKQTIVNGTNIATSAMSNIFSSALNKTKSKFTDAFNTISNVIKGALLVGSGLMVKFGNDAVQAASDTQSAWTGLYSIVNGTGKSFSEAQGFIEEYVNDGLVPLTDAVTAYKTLAARGYETEQIEGIMNALKDSASFGRQSHLTMGEAIKSASEGLKNENSVLVDNAGVTKNVAKMWDEYAESIGTTANNLTLAQKRLAEYNGIMEETKFQQGDAAKYADTYAGKLAKLNTAFYNLKVTVGQVLTPIVELFLPVITRVINGLTTMFNKLKSIMAVFGLEMKEYIGGGATSAISSATESTSGLSSGLESAGNTATKTAKKIKRAFAGIDEINVLNMPNDSSSSGGSGGSGSGTGSAGTGSDGLGGGFEDTKETVTQNLEWLKRSAYDWGVAFGESINNGLNLIPWDKIQSKVVNVVSKIAQFLNGAVEGLDWHLLGSTFGEGFNTVIYGLNTFYKEFNWANLGVGLGEGINGIFDSVDWKTLGEYLGRKFSSTFQVLSNMFETMNWRNIGTSLGQSLQSMIDNIDWDAIGKTFSNGINGIFDATARFFETVDWTDLGEKIYEQLENTMKNINWWKIGYTLGKAFSSAVDVLSETIGKPEFWDNLGDSLVTGINSFLENADLKKAGKTVANIVSGIINTLRKLIKDVEFKKALDETLKDVNIAQILWDIIMLKAEWKAVKWGTVIKLVWEGIKDAFVTGFENGWKDLSEIFIPTEEDMKKFDVNNDGTLSIGEAIVGGILQGIWNLLKSPLALMKKFIWDPFVAGVKAVFGIASPAKTMEPIGEDIILGVIQGIFGIKDKIVEKWDKVKKWFSDIKAKASVAISQKWADIKKKWHDLTVNIKNKTAEMKAKVATKWADIKKKWSDTTKNIKNKTADMKAKVATTWSNLKTKWNNLMSNFKDKTISIKTKIGEVIGNIKQTINDKVIKKINDKLPSIFPKIPLLAQGGWLKANNPRLAVVGDNKHEPEIVSPESKIYDQARKAVEDAGGSKTNQHFDFTIKLEYPDGKYLIKEINNQQIKDGYVSLLV